MDPEVQQKLQQKLAITPKTARLLMQLGFADYRDLQHTSPEQLVDQFAKLPEITQRQAETYRRAFRRMVWLGTQDNPEEQAKECQTWTQKALVAKGVWQEDYDKLTGVEANKLLQSGQ